MTTSDFANRLIEKHTDSEELKRLLTVHSECVARKAIEVADAYGMGDRIRRQFVWDAAMLHDIGIGRCDAPGIHCHGTLPYICHGLAGSELLKEEGVGEDYQRVCERHTGSGLSALQIEAQGLPLPRRDFLPETLEEKLICYADKFFSKSGDPAREKTLERVLASMERHGDEAMERFMEMHRMFTPGFE